MKKLLPPLLCFSGRIDTKVLSLFFIILMIAALKPALSAQTTTVDQTASFQSTNQNIFGEGPAAEVDTSKNFLFNENLKFFLSPTIGGITQIVESHFGFEVVTKAGLQFDFYTQIKDLHSGKVDLTYPIKAIFEFPTATTFGCGDTIEVLTSYEVLNTHNMNITPPSMGWELGLLAKGGFYAGGQICFFDCTGADFVEEPLGFKDATASNYESKMAGGFLPFFGIDTNTGIKWPWDYLGTAAPGGGSIPGDLPFTIPDFISTYTNLEGSIDNPFSPDGPETLNGNTLTEESSKTFLDIEFDPIQFQELLTRIPLTYEFSSGDFSASYTLFSLPLILDASQTQTFSFEPENFNITIDLGRTLAWQVKNESSVIINSGVGSSVTFRLGHTLRLAYPDNTNTTLTPDYAMTGNTFHTELNQNYDLSLGLKMLEANLSVPPITLDAEIFEVDLFPGLNEQIGPLVNEVFPITNFEVPVKESTFKLGGFSNVAGTPILLQPDQLPPVVSLIHPTVNLDENGNASIQYSDLIDSAYDPEDHGVNLPSGLLEFDCNNLGENVIPILASDNKCNQLLYYATVTITDEELPTIVCPPSQTLILGEDCTALLPDYRSLAVAEDNCEKSVSQLPTPGTIVSDHGPITITLTVIDESNNSSQCNFVVNKLDNMPPDIACFDQTITFNGETIINLNNNDLVDASDNCGVAMIELSVNQILCQEVGQIIPVTVTVTDINTNTSACTSFISVEGLPCGWRQLINGVGCDGGSNIAYDPVTEKFEVNSVNCYYANPFNADELAFAQRTLCGNGSITAQVTGITGNASGWAGIIMRESNAQGAKKVHLSTNLNANLLRREIRTSVNGSAQPQQLPALNRFWLHMVRQGNQFVAYSSPNGVNWSQAMSANVSMNNCIEMGLVLTNYNQNSTVNATFANVSFSDASAPMLPIDGNMATTGLIQRTPDFEVFPNPTSGELYLNLTPYEGQSVRIEVYNIQGQLLQFIEKEEIASGLPEKLDLTGHLPGMYFIKVRSLGIPDVTKRIVMTGRALRP